MATTIRRYAELARLHTFEDRFKYLRLSGAVGRETFGFDRYVNQQFYRSREWRQIRHAVIARDEGSDLGIPGFEIHSGLYIHHMNPMVLDDIREGNDDILNPEYLITVAHQTHNAIHYGVSDSYTRAPIERKPGDTMLWQRRRSP